MKFTHGKTPPSRYDFLVLPSLSPTPHFPECFDGTCVRKGLTSRTYPKPQEVQIRNPRDDQKEKTNIVNAR